MNPTQSKSIIAPAAIATITRHHSLARAAKVGLFALGLGAANHATAANLLVNGSFESNTVTDNGGEYALITAGNPSPVMPGWNVPNEVYWLYRNYQITAQDGNQWFGPQALTGDLASQNFSVGAGNTYEVSWYSQYRSGFVGTGTATITLASGAATGTTTMTTAADASWTQYSFSFTPDTTTTATLTLSAASGIQYFDNVSVAAIPEPSTALLGGLGVFALLRRHRVRQSGSVRPR